MGKMRVSLFCILILLSGCAYFYMPDDEDVLEFVNHGDHLVSQVECYRLEQGEYPEELIELVPDYLDVSELSVTVGSQEFEVWYSRYPDKKRFKLTYFPVGLWDLVDSGVIMISYYSDGVPKETLYREILGVYDDWVLQRGYRNYPTREERLKSEEAANNE